MASEKRVIQVQSCSLCFCGEYVPHYEIRTTSGDYLLATEELVAGELVTLEHSREIIGNDHVWQAVKPEQRSGGKTPRVLNNNTQETK